MIELPDDLGILLQIVTMLLSNKSKKKLTTPEEKELLPSINENRLNKVEENYKEVIKCQENILIEFETIKKSVKNVADRQENLDDKFKNLKKNGNRRE